MWLLVRYPNGEEVLLELRYNQQQVKTIKRGFRKMGGAVLAVYRRKSPPEMPDYD